jgi:hypothetical protein
MNNVIKYSLICATLTLAIFYSVSISGNSQHLTTHFSNVFAKICSLPTINSGGGL